MQPTPIAAAAQAIAMPLNQITAGINRLNTLLANGQAANTQTNTPAFAPADVVGAIGVTDVAVVGLMTAANQATNATQIALAASVLNCTNANIVALITAALNPATTAAQIAAAQAAI